jgi:acyl-CoA reductase-like NAD-dependent aldehyde dehydrogenase
MKAAMNKAFLLIGGQSLPSVNGRTFQHINPMSGEPVTQAASCSPHDVEAAVAAAAAALPAWSATGPSRRREVLLRAADLMTAHQGEFTRYMIEETGSTEAWAAFNVTLGASVLREAASITTQVTGEVIPSDVDDNLAISFRQPLGVCVGIAPWNAPVILGIRAIATPLACGNTIVFKASEACPAVHRLIGTVLLQAGLPAGVLNVLTNDPNDGATIVGALIDHPQVRHINFTGSTRVGRLIAERAARQLKPVLLELGGKAPFIVLDDAGISVAVDAAVFGAFMNQGQICMSTGRIIVEDRVADEFVERLARKAASLPLNDPSKGPMVLGTVIDTSSAEKISALIEDAVKKGARLCSGGQRHGTLVQATVLDRVTPEMRIYVEESFGPIVAVIRAANDKEALRLANDTEYGLSAAIFSRDFDRAWRMARHVESGICHINGPTVHDEPQMPFGGIKASGLGRFGGNAAINEFTVLRWITFQSGPRFYPF